MWVFVGAGLAPAHQNQQYRIIIEKAPEPGAFQLGVILYQPSYSKRI